jgi:hypothetical protein
LIAADARDAFGVAEVVEDEKAFLPDSADEDRVVVALPDVIAGVREGGKLLPVTGGRPVMVLD